MNETTSVNDVLKLENQFKSGASWFFWIAALSLVNSIILILGGNYSFFIGLGTTQLISALAVQTGQSVKIIAFFLNLIVVGIFIMFGFWARKKYLWSFIAGMIFYALDGLLFLIIKDYLSIVFHGIALIFIYRGLAAMTKLRQISKGSDQPTSATQ